jgi:hypothetical protein
MAAAGVAGAEDEYFGFGHGRIHCRRLVFIKEIVRLD